MTKREFDRLTKINYGAHMGARTAYRRERGRVDGRDVLAHRAATMRQLRDARPAHYGILATLGLGSPFRAGASLRLLGRFPVLADNYHEARAR
jgi:hypothetical protein